MALAKLSEQVRAAPEEASRYYDRACLLLTLRLFSEAVSDAEACLKLRPRYAKAYFAKGRALYFLGEYDGAFATYDAGLRIEPHPRIHTWLEMERNKREYAAASQLGELALASALLKAISKNDTKRLSLLLCRCPAEVIAGSLHPEQPPLLMAAAEGQVDCLVLLLQRGAPISGCDTLGRDALMLALEHGHVECACTLIEQRSDVTLACHAGLSALHRAATRGLSTCVSALLHSSADICGADAEGQTALHAACVQGEVLGALQLLAGAAAGGEALSRRFVELADFSGCTAVLLAARVAYHRPPNLHGVIQCISLLLQHGASATVSAKLDGRPLAFWLAAIGASNLLASLLAERRIAPNASCPRGLTALHVAAAHGELECVRMLLARGARPELCDSAGKQPAEHALRGVAGVCPPGHGHAECYQLLLRHLAR